MTSRLLALAGVALWTVGALAQPQPSDSVGTRDEEHVQALVVDLAGHGFKPSTVLRTSLVANGNVSVLWPAADAGVGFLVATGGTLQEMGAVPMWLSVSGQLRLLHGMVAGSADAATSSVAPAPRSGAAPYVRRPRGAWDVLAGADANHDRRLDARDPVWPQLRLFVDANADGVVDPGETKSLPEAGITAIVLPADPTGEGRFERGKRPGGKVLAVDLTPPES